MIQRLSGFLRPTDVSVRSIELIRPRFVNRSGELLGNPRHHLPATTRKLARPDVSRFRQAKRFVLAGLPCFD
jgi:hypothetical protein